MLPDSRGNGLTLCATMDKYPDVQHIGKALFRRRRELGLRQVEAARLLGVESRTLSRYERGEIEPKGAVIVARIARLFGDDVDPAELARLFLITKIHIGRQRAEDLRGSADRDRLWRPSIAPVDELCGNQEGNGEGQLGHAVDRLAVRVPPELAVVAQP